MKKIHKIIFIILILIVNNKNVYAEKTIDTGTYTIKSKINNNKTIDLPKSNTEDNTNIILYDNNNTNNQKWVLNYQKDDYYTIASAIDNSKVLQIENSTIENPQKISIGTFNNKNNQKWKLKYNEDGYFNIISEFNNYCLDIPASNTSNETNLIIYTCTGGNNQKFKFAENIKGEKTIENGIYNINIINNLDKALDVYNSKTKNKTNVTLYNHNNENNQKWIIKYNNDGYYTIKTKLDFNKCLDENGGNTNSGDNVQIYDCNNSEAQKWIIKDIGNGNYNIVTAGNHMYLNLEDDDNIKIYYKNNSNNQKFKLNKVNMKTIEDSTYNIKSYLNNNKVIDLPAGNTKDNTNIIIYDNYNSNNQNWILKYQEDGYYIIASTMDKNKVLQVDNIRNMQKISIGTFKNQENQKWELKYNSDGYFNIVSLFHNYCIDIPSSNTNNKTGLIIYTCTGGNNQKFKLSENIIGAKTIEDGIYNITHYNNSNKALDITKSQTLNKTNVILYDLLNTNNQKWNIKYIGDGYYTIKTRLDTNKCLDEDGGKTNSGDNVQIYSCNNSNAQKWIIKDIDNGNYNIITAGDHMYLNSEINENINVYYKKNNNDQKFKFKKIENKVIDTGIYTIKPATNNTKSLDIHGANSNENANIEIYDNHDGNNQKWYVSKNKNGYYTIKSGLNSNLYLSTISNTNKANVLITSKETLWEFEYIDNNNFYIKLKDNNLYLNLENINADNSSNINIQTGDLSDAQKFTFNKTDINTKAITISNGNYIINSKLDINKALDVHGSKKTNSTNIELYQINNENNQTWKLTYINNGYYTITSLLNTKTALDLQGGNTTSGTNIQLYKYNGTDSQLWRLIDDGNGSISIVPKKTNNLCISIKNSKTDNGVNIEATTCNNNNNQKFILTRNTSKRTYKGIDVSQYQANINWEKVSNNIDFAVIRLGYGDNWESQDDKKFERNVEECEKYNIPYTFYIYSYAKNIDGKTALNTDSQSAASEAEHVLRLLKKIKNKGYYSSMSTPIYIDMEEETTTYLGKDRLTKISDKFCTILENNGYGCGIYANKSWLNNYLNAKYLSNKYDIWIAEWIKSNSYTTALNSKPTYNTTNYKLWQFNAEGKIPGISGDVDLDIGYNIFD